ncbi:MAG: hypothetical protein OEV74_15105 [Cyclobacteriaceae bacterium]|nr:hypothetical protein [Cyclobacteriaceae bacterium]MDH4297607.1 hypothetical protein [Cyclobacteriaceae bacterium]MDH5247866.1 hypothetical protein [Cyclobacteriaceae bacterium]
MKKLIALLAVCGFALAFVACGKKAETSAEETVPATEEVVVESATMEVDSTAMPADSVAAE